MAGEGYQLRNSHQQKQSNARTSSQTAGFIRMHGIDGPSASEPLDTKLRGNLSTHLAR